MDYKIDPIQYEVYQHRLFTILEEGRLAMKMVSGSPVVVEGGETMCSLHLSDGTPVLTAAGILLHAIGARDFILKAIEWYDKDCVKISRHNQPNLLLRKEVIMYMFKEDELKR